MKNWIQNMLKSKNFYLVLVLSISLASCSTYQTVSNDNDGIYDMDTNSSTQKVAKNETKSTSSQEDKPTEKATKYQQYFKAKADKLNIKENEIFTDVDSYSSNENTAEEELLDKDVQDFSTNNTSWEDSGETVVNVYNYGYNRPYYSWYRPYYRPYYTGLYINVNPWWYSEFDYCLTGYNYYSPYYSPYYYGGYYGGYYPSYYTPYYYYTPNRYANYRYGRRNTSRSSTSTLRRNGQHSVRRSQNSNSTRTRSNIRNNTRSIRSNSVRNSSTPRVRTHTTSPRTHTTPRSHTTPRTRTVTPRVRTSTPRSSTRTKSYSSPVRRSHSSSRSYGSSSYSRSSRGSSSHRR